jgi:hypothetical protein
MILSDPSQIVGTGVAVSYRQDDGVHPPVSGNGGSGSSEIHGAVSVA